VGGAHPTNDYFMGKPREPPMPGKNSQGL